MEFQTDRIQQTVYGAFLTDRLNVLVDRVGMNHMYIRTQNKIHLPVFGLSDKPRSLIVASFNFDSIEDPVEDGAPLRGNGSFLLSVLFAGASDEAPCL